MSAIAVEGQVAAVSAPYRIHQRVVDWLTAERMQLINVTDRMRDGGVLLGTWQTIILAEFDGPRSRSLSVQVSGV